MLARRGLCIFARRGLCMVTHRGLCMVTHRGLCMVTHRGLCMVTHRGLCMVTHRGLCMVTYRGLCMLTRLLDALARPGFCLTAVLFLLGICVLQLNLAAIADESTSAGGAHNDLNFGGSAWRIKSGSEASSSANGSAIQNKPRAKPKEKWIPIDPNLLKWPSSGNSISPSGSTTGPVSSLAPGGSSSDASASGMASFQSFAASRSSTTPTSGAELEELPKPANDAASKTSKLDQEVKKLVAANDCKQAMQLMSQATTASPNDGHLWYNRGVVAEKLMKFSEAKDDYEKARTFKPTIAAKASLSMARAVGRGGDSKKASEMLWDMRDKLRIDTALEHTIDGLLVEFADEKAVSTPSIVADANDGQLIAGAVRADMNNQATSAITLTREFERHNSTRAASEILLGVLLAKYSKYSEALPLFKRADELDQSNPQVLIYIISCATQLGLLEDIQATRLAFISRFPNDPRSKKYQEQVEYYSKDFSKTREREDKPSRVSNDSASFSRNLMPLKVYVPDFTQSVEGWRSPPDPSVDCKSILQKVLSDWTDATSGKVIFQQCYNLDEANIGIEWIGDSTNMVHSFAAGSTGMVENGHGKRRCRIMLLVPTRRAPNSSGQFYETTLHEFGHALGLSHSSSPNDIMYFSALRNNETRALSDNDRTRINELYK